MVVDKSAFSNAKDRFTHVASGYKNLLPPKKPFTLPCEQSLLRSS